MNKANLAIMGSIIAAMAVEATPYFMATPKQVEKLLADGMVEQNTDIVDGDKIATRATEKGIAAMNETSTGTTGTAPAAASAFEIDDYVPAMTSRGGRTSVLYPFDTLEVNKSFHIPATEKRPNPAKSLASTVSAASKKYATDTGQTKTTPKGNTVPVLSFTRKFAVKAVGAEDPRGPGARVVRTA